MSVRKRNEYLDADLSEDEGSIGSGSDAGADSRTAGLTHRISKRQKLTTSTSESGDESDDNDQDSFLAEPSAVAPSKPSRLSKTPREVPLEPSSTTHPPTSLKEQKLLKGTNAASAKSKSHKPGVVYLSRIPPFMRPTTVRTHLSTHGPITKMFLTPEPPSHYTARRRAGGNRKHSFIDGWVEFARKKDAKVCVDAINGQLVGGKKGGWYRDDVWNARYLRGFGWGDLMAGVRQEEREREERVRVRLGREGRERGEFLRNLERSKVEETRREKKLKKRQKVEKEGNGEAQARAGEGGMDRALEKEKERGKGFERRFRQNEVKRKGYRGEEQPDQVRRVLSKIF
ncbi:RNA-binding ATPase activator esf2 [Mycoblastus sanguinarius]|nr:RNA-binding ATPase activator esf2 [Mycoblastus sanguinarius]